MVRFGRMPNKVRKKVISTLRTVFFKSNGHSSFIPCGENIFNDRERSDFN